MQTFYMQKRWQLYSDNNCLRTVVYTKCVVVYTKCVVVYTNCVVVYTKCVVVYTKCVVVIIVLNECIVLLP